MWLRDEALLAKLARIGRARVLELDVPMSATDRTYNAAQAVIATYGRSIGAMPEKSGRLVPMVWKCTGSPASAAAAQSGFQ